MPARLSRARPASPSGAGGRVGELVGRPARRRRHSQPTVRTAANGFHVLSVDGARYTTRFVPASGKGIAQLRVLVDAHALIVNVFDGGPQTQVTYQVAGPGKTEVALQRAEMADPYVPS